MKNIYVRKKCHFSWGWGEWQTRRWTYQFFLYDHRPKYISVSDLRMTVQDSENEGSKSGSGDNTVVYDTESEGSNDLTEIEVATRSNSPRT